MTSGLSSANDLSRNGVNVHRFDRNIRHTNFPGLMESQGCLVVSGGYVGDQFVRLELIC